MGLSFLSGIGVFIISMLVQGYLAKMQASYQRAYMKQQDERVSLTTR